MTGTTKYFGVVGFGTADGNKTGQHFAVFDGPRSLQGFATCWRLSLLLISLGVRHAEYLSYLMYFGNRGIHQKWRLGEAMGGVKVCLLPPFCFHSLMVLFARSAERSSTETRR